MKVLTDEVIASFKDAARKLTGPNRRAFQAEVTLDYLDGSIWKAERVFGWSHHTVALGLNELRTGITCQGNFSARGNHKTETKSPELEADIRALADPERHGCSCYDWSYGQDETRCDHCTLPRRRPG